MALKQRNRFSSKNVFAQIFLRVACVIHLKDSKIFYCSYSYTLRTQNNKAVLKTYLKSISMRYFLNWKAKSYFVLGFFALFFLFFIFIFESSAKRVGLDSSLSKQNHHTSLVMRNLSCYA